MPSNLTDDPSQYAANIQVPAAGDPRTDTSVATPFQQLANRTANATARIDVIAAPGKLGYSPALPAGVSLGSVALNATSIAALQSIPAANRVDGMLANVANGGAYRFDIASVATPASPQIVQPSDLPVSGRWIAIGLVPVDTASRVPAANVRNGIVGIGGAAPGNFVTSSTTYVDLTGVTVTLTGLAIGDMVQVIYGSTVLPPASASLAVSHQLLVVRPDTTTLSLLEKSVLIGTVSGGPDRMPDTLAVVYSITQNGTHVFKTQGKSATASAATFGAPTISVLAVRP